SGNLPNRSAGIKGLLESACHFNVFSNGIAHAVDGLSRGKNDLSCTVSTDNRQANGPASLSGLASRSPPVRVPPGAVPRRQQRRGDPRSPAWRAPAPIGKPGARAPPIRPANSTRSRSGAAGPIARDPDPPRGQPHAADLRGARRRAPSEPRLAFSARHVRAHERAILFSF